MLVDRYRPWAMFTVAVDEREFPRCFPKRSQPLPTFSWPIFSFTPHIFSSNGLYRFTRPYKRRNAVGCVLSCEHNHVSLSSRCIGSNQ